MGNDLGFVREVERRPGSPPTARRALYRGSRSKRLAHPTITQPRCSAQYADEITSPRCTIALRHLSHTQGAPSVILRAASPVCKATAEAARLLRQRTRQGGQVA